jgi:hypothetical protein
MKHHHHHRNRKPKKLVPTDSSIIEDRAASTILRSEMPPEVEAEIQAGKAMFEQMLEEGPKDEHYERILATMLFCSGCFVLMLLRLNIKK